MSHQPQQCPGATFGVVGGSGGSGGGGAAAAAAGGRGAVWALSRTISIRSHSQSKSSIDVVSNIVFVFRAINVNIKPLQS